MASSQTYGYARPPRSRERKAPTSASSPPHSPETSELDSDPTPSASDTRSTFRVETPATYISWTSATIEASTRV